MNGLILDMEVVTLNQLNQWLVSFMQQLAIPLGLLLLLKAGLGIRPQICSLISFGAGSYNQVIDFVHWHKNHIGNWGSCLRENFCTACKVNRTQMTRNVRERARTDGDSSSQLKKLEVSA